MRIAVIGSGKMGGWFAEHFRNSGADVSVYDIDKQKAEEVATALGVKHAASADEALGADVVIICVSISKTADAIRKIGGKMKKGQTLVEIASLKGGIAEELKKLECEVLSMHPMFGPKTEGIDGQNVIVVSDLSSQEAKEALLPLFKGARITECTLEEHEKAMAIVLSLPYAMNIAFMDMVEERNLPEEFSGPTFLRQLEVAGKVAAESEDLKGELLKNAEFRKTLDEYVKRMKEAAKA